MSKNATCAAFARASIAIALSGIFVWSSALSAAEQAKTGSRTEDEELSEVQVTGTRIQSPNVTAANPVTSITSEEMRRLGIVNVADALTQLVPQNISTYMPTMTGETDSSGNNFRGQFFIGNTIANLRGLDPQFGSRTLTLIDGKRVASTSNQADVVDLNIIPSNLLERMDVVTGGASATYGSGAMAGVVNLVLNRRLNGLNLDMDYGVNEAGDGGSPHISLSGGTSFFNGSAHALFGAEFQKQDAIRDCAAARSWCAESRQLFANTTTVITNPSQLKQPVAPTPGFAGYPARFATENYSYSQFSPSGTIYYANANVTSDYAFTDEPDGTKGIKEYALGFRGGNTSGGVINGDGPVTTSGTTLLPSTDRKSLFTNFEYDIDSSTTAYLQARYAVTDNNNRNRYTRTDNCVRFNTQGVSLVAGGTASAGQFVSAATSAQLTDYVPGVTGPTFPPYPARSPLFTNANFRAFMGISALDGSAVTFNAPGASPATASAATPYWVTPGQYGTAPAGSATSPPPNIVFQNGVPQWRHVRSAATEYWILVGLTIANNFNDPGTPAVLPTLGRNAYAFLTELNSEALSLVQNSFGSAGSTFGAIADPTTGQPLAGAGATVGGNGGGAALLWGGTPCAGFTAIRKVWNPQVQQFTTQKSTTWGVTGGIRGRFGEDWRWDASYQYGATDSTSRQNNVATNISSAFAMDAVIDDRKLVNGAPNPTYGQPVCRIIRDGIPPLDWQGEPLSDPEGFAQLAAGCQPLNVFGTTASAFTTSTYGTTMTAAEAAEMQRKALNYAFRDSVSDGGSSLQQLSLTVNGTLWQGWAGPLSGAFGLELNENTVNNRGTRGPLYLRADIARAWGDAFGGRTRVAEGYAEFNMPIVTGQDGLNLFSIDTAIRWGFYNNKGGAGTVVNADGNHLSATQDTPNWKFSTEFSPFDWVRFRLTRSRDLRAAGYRELFINQPSVADGSSGQNPWRDRTLDSNENQFERYGTITVGNPNLKPEKSDTLTLGLVLRPGGWAQGMSFTADYYDIRVKDGIAVQFGQAQPINACWTKSGNTAKYVGGDENPAYVNGQINMALPECQAITFAKQKDERGNDIDGTIDLGDIISYNTGQPSNGLPYQRRGLDLTWSYNFPLNRAFESLPGSVALNIRSTRALESSGSQNFCTAFITGTLTCQDGANGTQKLDLVGQIRTSGNVYIAGVAPTPKWVGNVSASYLYGDWATTLSAKYVGGAVFDKTWTDDPNDPSYWATDANGNLLLDSNGQRQFSNASVDNNRVDPYVNFSLNASYNLKVANLKQCQIFGSINNLFDKSPPFTGGSISGASAQYNDTLGRAYRMGVRLKF